MGSQEKMEARQSYTNEWHTSLMDTMKADLPLPVVFHINYRNELYTMICQGTNIVVVTCLVAAVSVAKANVLNFVVCCFNTSVASTRFLLQDESNIQTTKCDNCIIGCTFLLGKIAFVYSFSGSFIEGGEVEGTTEILFCLYDAAYCTVCACMQTQHKIEMDKRDGKFGPPPVMMVPPVQQMSRIDKPVPPIVGHPPQLPPTLPPYGCKYPPHIPGYPAVAAPAYSMHPPGYPASVSPLAGAPVYFLASGYPPPRPQGYHHNK